MKPFLKRLLQFLLPIFVLFMISFLSYLILDPFKVVKKYDTFYEPDEKTRVGLNKDYVSTMTFIANSANYNYDSFIFGNSRSIFYRVEDWEKHLPNNATCFHFDASGESLWAMNKKFDFLQKKEVPISNALILFDYSTLIQISERDGHLFKISPPLVEEKNWFDFQLTYYKTFLTPKFLFAFLDYKISKKVKPYMKTHKLIGDEPIDYLVRNNEIQLNYIEKLIEENRFYTDERMQVFYQRDSLNEAVSPVAIKELQKEILQNIKEVLHRNRTNYRIIISPLYDQQKLNPEDLNYLQDVFGSENVFDFSGKNKITNDYKNYYENSHYRPHVAKMIMDSIYATK